MSNSKAHQPMVVNDKHTSIALPLLSTVNIFAFPTISSYKIRNSFISQNGWLSSRSQQSGELDYQFCHALVVSWSFATGWWCPQTWCEFKNESITIPSFFAIQSSKIVSVFSPLNFSELTLWSIGLLFHSLRVPRRRFCGRVHWDMWLAVWMIPDCGFISLMILTWRVIPFIKHN